MAKRKSNKLVSLLTVVALLVISVIVGNGVFDDNHLFENAGLRDKSVDVGKMTVEFIDVGQGDCTLITTSDTVILVDGGEVAEAQKIINYLKNKNINKIDCCIATHPHSDHIGSLYKVFEEFEISDVIMPEAPEKIIPTTTTYERFLESVSQNVQNVLPAVAGENHTYGQIKIEILGPVSEYDDLNNISVVSKIIFGDTSVMLTGDAETPSEVDMLKNIHTDYSADVLKVGHHGSKTSTSEAWLNAVSPQYAVILCGKNNDYGHPHKQLTERLKKFDIDYYRTDLAGDIVFESDGKNITLISESK